MNTQVWMAVDTIDALIAEADDVDDLFLSLPERVRATALIGLQRKARYRAGRWLMRKLLARVHGGSPLTDWPLTADVDNAPTFLGEAFAQRAGAQWRFSVSEAGLYVACAMSASPLGLDIEVPERERDVMALGDVLCNPDELAHLRSLKGAERESWFLALWALKEAAIKREAGRSTSRALRRLATREIGTDELARVLPADPASEPRSDAWTWQSPELTLAVVTQAACTLPQWAMPPPAFMLRPANRWSIDVIAPLIPEL